jgi:hypothetical protein
MIRRLGPFEGEIWPPNHSGNNITWDGSTVIKRYPGKALNYYREHALLSRLDGFAVPRILPGSRPGELHLAYIDGLHGCQTIDSGKAGNLLREMGSFLAR